MKIYVKYILNNYLNSLLFVILIMSCLVFILNLLSELDFFKNEDVSVNFSIFLSLLNTPSLIFEMFPFIMLLTIQLFFIKILENKEMDVLKYFGLKNTKILYILSFFSIVTGIIILTIFYSLSSTLKNYYLELKLNYATDGKYLAVITNNGLWIKDSIGSKTIVTNSSYIENNFLIENFITVFDNNFNVIKNIKSEKIDITDTKWKINNARTYKMNDYSDNELLYLETNFDLERIRTLYSNLSALNLFELYELRKNYKKLNYSIIDIDIHVLKLISYPIYLFLMALFSSLIMINIKRIKNTTFKIFVGLFFSVIIYYLNNFSYVLGETERINIIFSVLLPLLILSSINISMLYKINDK